jgi:methionyl-tRNA formyltransferase
MKIMYLGSDAFAVPPLETLIKAGYKPDIVVSMPDRPSGRGRRSMPTPVKTLAETYGIPVWTPAEIKSDEAFEHFKSYQVDVLICVAYGRILPKRWLDMPWALNIHPSLLPRWRGATPLEHTILAQDTKGGVSIIRMSPEIDAGHIVWQANVDMNGTEETKSFGEMLFAKGSEALLNILSKISQQKDIPMLEQSDVALTHAPKFKKEDGLIDWTASAEAIHAKIRAFHQWPVAYTKMAEVVPIKIFSAIFEKSQDDPGILPGTICKQDRHYLWVQCGKGQLGIQEIQFPGKKRILISQLQGYEAVIGNGKRFET